MKIDLVSFTNYKLRINRYYKKNMDFFSFLLLKIILKEEKEDRTLKEILLDFDLTEPIMYLVSSSLYNLIDNGLIECDDDINTLIHKDIKAKDIAYECLKNNYILEYYDTIEQDLSLCPISKEVVVNSKKNSDNYVVSSEEFSLEEISKYIKKEEGFSYQIEILEANPLIREWDQEKLKQ